MAHRLPIARRRSRIAGWGVFATASIPKETRVVEYKGELVSQTEAGRREDRYLPRERIWIFNINRLWARDAGFGGNIARYVNHACRPNCYIEVEGHAIWILTSRRIRKGEELTYDYNTDGAAGIECGCRPRCRRMI